jgi:alpha-beta hydrolase superfamily lysophospholipase
MRSLAVLLAAIATTSWSSSTPRGAAPPPLATACGSALEIAARALWLTSADRVRLYAIEAGDGAVGVVLAHQGRSDLCEELPYAKTLVDAGLHVLAFDFRGNGHSARPAKNWLAYRRDFAAALRRLRADGATRVFLVGASMGGAAAVQNSAGLPVAGIVSLSGTRLWPGYGNTIARHSGSRDKRSIFYRGSLHGWQLVQDAPFAPKARALILAWIHGHSRP